ncbi:poly [ADP-ribose] polymerase tankyrase-like [Lineus longissimus]|uniref:poly [ADP-ribose] polymerase tankyrase-like n=1 Tax=Lineus longissimus TaxID=88925 RepID=UPI00315DEE1D
MAASCFDWLWKVIGADGKTVKDLAEEKGLSDVLELVELAKEDQGKVTTLLKAAKAGNLDEIKKILDADPKLASYKNKSGRCILHQAVLYEQKEVVEYLVGQYEALVGAKDNLGRLPLHYAAAQTDGEEMYAVLAGAGSDEDAKDWNNLSGKDYKKEMALHADDADAGHYNVQAIIERERSLKYGSAVTVKQNYNAMAECIENNDIQGVRNIERNLEVPFNDIQKVLGLGVDPLLFICARTGAQDIAKAFIDDGADLEINREDGTTLIDYVKTLGLTDLHKIIANKIKADHEAATIPLQKQLSVESLTSLELEPIIPEVPIKDVPPPSTIDGKYLAQNVGAALEEALAEICQKRPHDPVEYLAQYLYKYDNNMKYAKEVRP